MGKRVTLWVGVALMALAAHVGAEDVTYTAGQNRTEGVDASTASQLTFTDVTATQSGAIAGTAVLTITGGTGAAGSGGTLHLAGDNTGFTGTVAHDSGTLVFGESANLLSVMSKYDFNGDMTDQENIDVRAAIIAYAATPTDQNWQDVMAAIAAAQAAGTLPTFAVAAGKSVSIDSGGIASDSPSQRLAIADGKAGSFHLEDGAKLTFTGSAYEPASGNAEGGALRVGSGSLLALTAGDGAGYVFTGNSASAGYYIAYGGAIFNSGTLTLTNADFTGNSASGYYIACGGAISNSGTLTLTNADFTGNSASGESAYGGAIFNTGTLTLTNADFTGNSASGINAHGGAISNGSSPLTLTNADFTGNSASGSSAFGGAIFNSGTLTLTNADFTGNSASGMNYAYGGAIYNYGTLTLNVDAGKRSVFTGNVAVTGGAASANSIYINDSGTLAVDTAAGAVLDMRDPMGGYAYGGNISISKSGDGTWKLGGKNVFASIGGYATTFAVEAGTLYLYRAGEVDNANYNFVATENATVEAGSISLAGSGSAFTLGTGATLAVGGGAWTTVAPNSITATTITIGNGATLAFDLAHHDAVAPINNEMLTLTGNVGLTDVTSLTIDLLSLNTTAGTYELVQRSAGDDFGSGITYSLTLRGESIAGTRAAGAGLSVTPTADTISVTQGSVVNNAVVTWTGADSSNGNYWNITAKNWDGSDNQFLHGDIVNFDGAGTIPTGGIAINPDGDGTVRAAGMYVSGGADYEFTGGGIELDGATGATTLTGAAVTGKLVLGAKATDATTVDTTATFSGTVDLTGTTANHFKGGVDLYSGSLRIASAAQLGTDLGKVSFLADATGAAFDDLRYAIRDGDADVIADEAEKLRSGSGEIDTGVLPTIVIAEDADVVFNGAGGASQRLEIGGNKAGSFHLEKNAKLTFKGSAHEPASGPAEGGALLVSLGSLLALTADGGVGYVFTGNSATATSGYANGGAISNTGTLTLTNAAFTGNSATGTSAMGGAIINSAVSAAMNLTNAAFIDNFATATAVGGQATGGAIYSVSDEHLTLSGVDFTGNHATGVAAMGGAIFTYSDGSITLTDANFTMNRASGEDYASGGAIFTQHTTINLKVSEGAQSVFTGNVLIEGVTMSAGSIYFNEYASLNVDTGDNALLDMRDPMSGYAANAATNAIVKTGDGIWKLGGDNAFFQVGSGKTTFAVNEGTLYLYRAGEVDNANPTYTPTATVEAGGVSLAGTGSAFTLADGATLKMSGVGHKIEVASGTIALAGDLAFDMTDATTSTTSLSLTAATIDTVNDGAKIGSGDIYVSEFTAKAAIADVGDTYTLVDTGTSTSATVNTGALYVDGTRHYTGRTALDYGLAVNPNSSQLLIKFIDATKNADLTWTNAAATGIWNAADRNWSGTIDDVNVDQFLTNDNVIFASNASAETISVDLAGVTAGDMTVNGAYNFTGGVITAKDVEVGGTNGKLGLAVGATAALVADSIDFNTTGVLNITGYNPAADVNPFDNPLSVTTIIETTGGVTGFGGTVSVLGQTAANAFLTAYAYVDGTDMKVATGLYWYSTDPARKAHGAFEITGDNTFTLGAELKNNSASANKAFGWDGNSLTKTGGGTLVLTAANTYTGATAVSAGTLRLANVDAVQYSAVTVASGATLAVDQSSNVQSLSLADNSTIEISTNHTITATTGDIDFAGNVAFDLSSLATGSYDLLIASTGNVNDFDASKITTLINGVAPAADRANITYSLDTTGSETVKLDLSIHNLALTWKGGDGNWTDANWDGSSDNLFYAGDSVTFASGSGAVAIDPTGVLVADMTVSGGDYTFSGGSISSTNATTLGGGATEKLTLSGGSATFNNPIDFAGGIAVKNGGKLYGSASMTGGAGGVSIDSGGAFGATAGATLTIDSLTMASGSTFAMGDKDSLVSVTGAAAIANGVAIAYSNDLAADNTYTILSAGSAITGWSGPVVDVTTSAFLRYTVDTANGGKDLAVLVEEYRKLLDLGLTPNQAAVLSGLERWNGGNNEIINAVKALGTDAEAIAALDALTGQLHRNIPAAMIRLNRGYWRLLDGPVLSLREDIETTMAAGDSRALASLNPRAGFGPRPLFWFSGGGLYSRSRSDADTARDRLNGTEFMVGGELPLAGWNLGLAFRYADTRLKVEARSSHADLDNYQLGLYAMRAIPLGSGQLRLTLGASGGYHDIESRRNVAFGAISQRLRSDYDAWSFSGLAEAGYRLDVSPCLAVEPYVSLGWDSVWNESFAESGGSAALRGESDHQGNLSSILGTRLSYRLTERVSIDANAGWRHTYGNVRPRSGLAFAASPTRDSFTVVGTKLARDEFVGGLGARVDLTERVFLRADYQLEAGSGGHSHRGTLSVGVGF